MEPSVEDNSLHTDESFEKIMICLQPIEQRRLCSVLPYCSTQDSSCLENPGRMHRFLHIPITQINRGHAYFWLKAKYYLTQARFF